MKEKNSNQNLLLVKVIKEENNKNLLLVPSSESASVGGWEGDRTKRQLHLCFDTFYCVLCFVCKFQVLRNMRFPRNENLPSLVAGIWTENKMYHIVFFNLAHDIV